MIEHCVPQKPRGIALRSNHSSGAMQDLLMLPLLFEVARWGGSYRVEGRGGQTAQPIIEGLEELFGVEDTDREAVFKRTKQPLFNAMVYYAAQRLKHHGYLEDQRHKWDVNSKGCKRLLRFCSDALCQLSDDNLYLFASYRSDKDMLTAARDNCPASGGGTILCNSRSIPDMLIRLVQHMQPEGIGDFASSSYELRGYFFRDVVGEFWNEVRARNL